jgi:type II secretory pathway pseudopilin PulG
MNLTFATPHRHEKGLSLVEMSLVIALMLGLATIVTYSISGVLDWRLGRDATEKLRAVYIAQRSFLADRPSKTISTFTTAELIPYLPGTPGAMPTAKAITGQALILNFTTMPPFYMVGTQRYDPSGSQTDGIWDVGTL